MRVLDIQNLSKSYGRIKAVNQLNLTVESGQIMGLLGPNGSGKTTTLGILLDILRKDEGSFSWFGGQYGKHARKKLGALLETPNFYPYLDADQNLDIVAHIKGIANQDFTELLQLVNLEHRRKSNFSTYSLGMKQRLAIAATLIGDPEVLIFDEPSNGLDPQGIAEVRNTLLKIAKRGKTILMASHILDEVEKVCTHVAIIKNGKLLATGPVGAIINNEITIEAASAQKEQLQQFLQTYSGLKALEDKGAFFVFNLEEGKEVSEINRQAFEQGIILRHLVARPKSLEAEFLEITK